MRMHKLNRIFQGDDVHRASLVDFVEHCGESRRFARSGCTRNQYQAGFLPWDEPDDFRELKPVERGNIRVEFAANDGVIAALGKNINTKTRFVLDGVSRVARSTAQQVLGMPGVFADQIERNHLRLVWSQKFDGRIRSEEHTS